MSRLRLPFQWLLIAYGSLFALIIIQADRRALPGFVYRIYGGMPAGDLLGHLCLLGGASFVLHGWWHGRNVGRPGRRLPRATPVLVILATVEELSQSFFPTRSVSVTDLLANYSGIAAGGLLAQPWAGVYCLRSMAGRLGRATWELGPLTLPILRLRRRRARALLAA